MTAKKTARKFRSIEEAPRLIPTVSSTIKSRRKTPNRVAGRHERTEMRRLLEKKLALITPKMIDKKSDAWRNYQKVISGLTSDLGGRLTTVEQVLVNAFSAATVRLADLTARQLLGDQSVVQQKGFAQTVTALVRLSERLGVARRPKELPSLSTYLNSKANGGDTVEGEILDD